MKKRYMVAMVTLAILALAAFSTPALAQDCLDDVETRAVGFTPTGFTNGTVNDGTVIALEGGSGSDTWEFNLPSGSDYYAYAHWHSWGGCEVNPTAEFCNGNGVCQTIHIIDCVFDDNISGCFCSGASPGNGTHHFFWKVNAAGGSNNLTLSGCAGVYDKWFVAVIDNTDPVTHDGYWWHNFGLTDACNTGSPYSTWFYGPIDTSADHTLWTAQSHYGASYVSIDFNDQHYGDVVGTGGYPFSLAMFHVDNTDIDTDGSQKATWENHETSGFTYIYTYLAVLAEEIPLPDIVLDPGTFTLDPVDPRENEAFTVSVDVTNIGSADITGTFYVCLYIDDIFIEHKPVTGLNRGQTKTVTFSPISRPAGCYKITVKIDNYDDIPESNEYNNIETEYLQVGNVIVVESNSDFDVLVGEGLATEDGGTYYIEGKTITNCGGCGITIKNTDVPFVIDDCTVENCGYDGVDFIDYYDGICLENVANGKVTGSTINHNSEKGISILESTYVDITDNSITNNIERITAYGVEVGEVPLDDDDPKYINIKNNEFDHNSYGIQLIGSECDISGNDIQDSAGCGGDPGYGIYVLANDSRIYNNTIEDSHSYGIKAYNSTDNCIYENTFINNNGGAVGGGQAWDNSVDCNYWNTTIEVCYFYQGASSCNVSRVGNYWGYVPPGCIDDNNDGICDNTEVTLDGGDEGVDYHPLMDQWCFYVGVKCGNMNCDDYVNAGDAGALDLKLTQPGSTLNCDWASNMNCDDYVNAGDAGALDLKLTQPGSILNCCKGRKL